MPDSPTFSVGTVTGPASEPVTRSEMESWLRTGPFDDEDEAAKIDSLITAARTYCEAYTRRICLPTTFRLTLDRFPQWPDLQYGPGLAMPTQPVVNNTWPLDASAWALLIPRSPVFAINSVQWLDGDGVTVRTMDPATYQLDADSEPARLIPIQECYWPTGCYGPGAVTITFTAGYASAAAVPAMLKVAIKMLAAMLYDNPGGLSQAEIKPGACLTALLDAQKVRYTW